MKIAAFAIIPVEVVSIVCNFRIWDSWGCWIGIGIAAFGVLIFAAAVIMLHLQILQEEEFLTGAFGEPYREYMKRTGRYFIFDKI